MKSTSGLSIWPRNWRAYADSDSTYRRCPSAKIVSNAREDLRQPDRRVNTTRESLGSPRDTSFRLCSRAPRTISRSLTSPSRGLGEGYGGSVPMLGGGSDRHSPDEGSPRPPAAEGPNAGVSRGMPG